MDDAASAEAMSSGDQRRALEALRDRLIDGVLAATDRKLIHLAPVAKQLVDVLDRIEALEPAQGDELDDLVARRAARRAAAKAG